MSDNPIKYVTIEALSDYLSLSISTIRSWVKNGKIPKDTFIKIGITYRFNVQAIEEALLCATQDELTDADESMNKVHTEIPRQPVLIDVSEIDEEY